MEQYAYIRVSTKEQHIDRQIMALKPYSISPKNYICLFNYLFISSQMSAKPYFMGSTGILHLR